MKTLTQPDIKYKEVNGTSYYLNTPQEVINILEASRDSGVRLRFWYGKDGLSWNEENDIMGTIGRSTGICKIPLLINNTRSMGGGALMTDSIVKIVDTATKRVLYQHPKFKQTYFGADDILVWKGAPGTGEEIYATCKTPEQAQRLADFMNGMRNSK